MATSAKHGQLGPGQELDLSGGAPSPAVYGRPLDRFQIGVGVDSDGFGGWTDIRVKGSLQPTAELLVLCVCSLLTVLVVAWVCQLGQLEGWWLLAICAAAGMAMFGGGARYLTAQRRRYSATKRRKG